VAEKKYLNTSEMVREKWSSKLGVVLAVAGSAIGLGNFLRFPVQAVRNGGGAFLIPYLISLVLMGIPLMWIEWTLGRRGGNYGHGSAPGIFQSINSKNNCLKYIGVLGVFGPVVIFLYYVYIESWLLGYSIFSLLGTYHACPDQQSMASFLRGYQGLEKNQFFSSLGPAYFFFLLTFFTNVWIIYRGVSKGIEKVCLWAVPLLLLLGIAMMVRVLTLQPAVNQAWTPAQGLAFLWNPDFSALKDTRVWLAAAGQIFFTLSVGIGVILTYASYLTENSDIILSGLTAAASNELAEVILGSSIAIPAAFVFFGPVGIQDIAKGGAFDLAFVTMPLVLKPLPLGEFFGFLWFALLFLAGLTSSISLVQPAISFLEDEVQLPRQRAVVLFGLACFILCHFPIFYLSRGVVDELDFWGGTFSLVVFATTEAILFGWVLGMDKAWKEMHAGAQIKLPRIYRPVIKYVTPCFLIVILISWLTQQAPSVLLLKGVAPENVPYLVVTRIILLLLLAGLGLLIRQAWSQKGKIR